MRGPGDPRRHGRVRRRDCSDASRRRGAIPFRLTGRRPRPRQVIAPDAVLAPPSESRETGRFRIRKTRYLEIPKGRNNLEAFGPNRTGGAGSGRHRALRAQARPPDAANPGGPGEARHERREKMPRSEGSRGPGLAAPGRRAARRGGSRAAGPRARRRAGCRAQERGSRACRAAASAACHQPRTEVPSPRDAAEHEVGLAERPAAAQPQIATKNTKNAIHTNKQPTAATFPGCRTERGHRRPLPRDRPSTLGPPVLHHRRRYPQHRGRRRGADAGPSRPRGPTGRPEHGGAGSAPGHRGGEVLCALRTGRSPSPTRRTRKTTWARRRTVVSERPPRG